MAVITEPNNARYSVTIPNTNSTEKDTANVIQSLQVFRYYMRKVANLNDFVLIIILCSVQ